jgi:5,10-methylene-tetrahydrofolate dehydrogenase/methenyl tetrahydrofolate cyclohydrolase
MALTDVKARNAKPSDKQVKLYDSNGLFLLGVGRMTVAALMINTLMAYQNNFDLA